MNQRVAAAVFNFEFVGHLPAILAEELHHVAAIGSVRADADFSIGAEQAARRIADRGAGAAGTGVDEDKAAVLIVGAAGHASDVDLIVVVLASAFKHRAELESVGTGHLGGVVGDGVDGTGRTGRIGAAGIGLEARDVHGGQLVGKILARGENERIVDAVGGAVERGCAGHAEAHLIAARRDEKFIHHGRADGAGPTQGRRLVRPVNEAVGQQEVRLEGVDVVVVINRRAELERVLGRRQRVDGVGVFTLVHRCSSGAEPVVGTLRHGQVGIRVDAEQSQTLAAGLPAGDDVAGVRVAV